MTEARVRRGLCFSGLARLLPGKDAGHHRAFGAVLAACSFLASACGEDARADRPIPAFTDSLVGSTPAGSPAGDDGAEPGNSPNDTGSGSAPPSSNAGSPEAVAAPTLVPPSDSTAAAPAAAGPSADAGVVTAPGTAAPPSAGPEAPAASDRVLRVLAVGDSITHATCWRAVLWQSLMQSFPGRFDFVGTLTENSGCTPAGYDRDNQGYSSSLVTEVVAGITNARTCDPACPTLAEVAAAFAQAEPDVILMHFGTNDVWNGRPIEAIVSAYSQIVQAARAANPAVTVLTAQIIPMNVTNATCAGCTCANCARDVPALNARIVSWAAGISTAASPVRVVDQFTGYDAAQDNVDGVHPNAGGAAKIAARWYSALEGFFR